METKRAKFSRLVDFYTVGFLVGLFLGGAAALLKPTLRQPHPQLQLALEACGIGILGVLLISLWVIWLAHKRDMRKMDEEHAAMISGMERRQRELRELANRDRPS